MRYPAAAILALLLFSGCHQSTLKDGVLINSVYPANVEVRCKNLGNNEARCVIRAPEGTFSFKLVQIPARIQKMTLVLKKRKALTLMCTDYPGGTNWTIFFDERSVSPTAAGVTVTRKGEDFEVVFEGAGIALLRQGRQFNFYDEH